MPDETIVLADFGSCDKGEVLEKQTGSVGYFAPEIMHGSYTNKVDIFSTGITIMMLLTSKHPFMYKRDDMKDTMRRNKIGKIIFHEEIW